MSVLAMKPWALQKPGLCCRVSGPGPEIEEASVIVLSGRDIWSGVLGARLWGNSYPRGPRDSLGPFPAEPRATFLASFLGEFQDRDREM